MDTDQETQERLRQVLGDERIRKTLSDWIDALIRSEYDSFSAKKQATYGDESMRLLVLQAGVEKLLEIKNTINS